MARQPAPLDPDARSTLRSVLLPPEGYRLEHALATAYSLDAETLVTIPLFAAGSGAEELKKPVGISRIYELGARLTLLVQGDRISIARRWAKSRPLLRLVGDAVVPCSIDGGSFHPKLLVLEFRSTDDPKRKLHRVVVATRNLTTDNSWDSVIVLEEAKKGVSVSGLAETVIGLAQFVNDKKHPATERCRQVGNALKKVTFQPLRGITDLEVRLFHPGSGNAMKIREQIRGVDLLVISPFVRKGFLDDLALQAGSDQKHRWLVTRPVDVPESAFDNYQVFKITDAAVPQYLFPGTNEEEESDEQSGFTGGERGQLVGLHAKIYVASPKKGETRIVVTSANATPSGWINNVEVAVSGLASGKAFQVSSMLAPNSIHDQERTFRDLLDEFTYGAVVAEAPEADWLRHARRELAKSLVRGVVTKGPPRTLKITAAFPTQPKNWPVGLKVTMQPFGYGSRESVMVLNGNCLEGWVEIEAGIELTPFVTLVLTKGQEPSTQLVLSMQLKGDLDWSREDARKALVQARSGRLLQDLLWYFGVKGGGAKSNGGRAGPRPKQLSGSESALPILEKVLLRVHGNNAKVQIQEIDGLLEGVTDDLEYGPALAEMWKLVKASLK